LSSDSKQQDSLLSRKAFPESALISDVRDIKSLPKVDVLAAGFPCQDLSLVGSNKGIFGDRSGLVHEIFRLVASKRSAPDWLLLENVPFMLRHKQGHAIRYVLEQLEELGFRWAYRIVDSQHFGLPQRRRRVLIVASRKHDPRTVLFSDDTVVRSRVDDGLVPCGFYWTEGRGGLGWAINSVPTLKGGSSIGIPSPPAIWHRAQDLLVTPEIRDAERMQGFPVDWTLVEDEEALKVRIGQRWKMVGNAVTVPVAEWIGSRLMNPDDQGAHAENEVWQGGVWPTAAYGSKGVIHRVHVTEAPLRVRVKGLNHFLRYPTKLLSAKATAGFTSRAKRGSLRFAPGFLEACERHFRRVS
jgi:DNA (cytosine-5)-methyltransferase 1